MNSELKPELSLSSLFLLLIISQTLHSTEEYLQCLWEVFEPARIASNLVSSDLEFGFIVINTSIVALGYLCYFLPVKRRWRHFKFVAGFWGVFELANASGHILVTLVGGSYIPGILTAPLLLTFSVLLLLRLKKTRAQSPSSAEW